MTNKNKNRVGIITFTEKIKKKKLESVGSVIGSGYTFPWSRSGDPDQHQNEVNPQQWLFNLKIAQTCSIS